MLKLSTQKGLDHFESAQLLQRHQRYRDAVSRAYYAIYTAVVNWVGPGRWNHNSIRSAFAWKMRQQGIPGQRARYLNRQFLDALLARTAADYDLDEVTLADVQRIMNTAQTILTFLEQEVTP